MLIKEAKLVYSCRRGPTGRAEKLHHSSDVADLAREVIGTPVSEEFWVVALNTKHRPLFWHMLSKGSMDSSIVDPAMLFKVLFSHEQGPPASCILVHLHPSGDCAPSAEDRVVTTRVAAAGKILGIDVLDHVILGDEEYFSFRDSGEL